MSENPYRLSDKAVPMHYRLDIRVDIENFRFSGDELISIRLLEPTKIITLNSAGLNFIKPPVAEIILQDNAFVPSVNTVFNEGYETVSIEFESVLPAGIINLRIAYDGDINDKLGGFYRTWYTAGDDQPKRWGAATQFEPTDARRAFPCFDEPDKKATFAISLTVPKHMTALSNMPVAYTQDDAEEKTRKVAFKVTPTMSTYLVAWVVAELEHINGITKRGTPISVYTIPGKKEHGRFALQLGINALEYFEEWFGIPYLLPKLDMVGMPDFAAGAMENWGLVTYRETSLLVDPAAPTAAFKQRVAETVAHELAHMWFGNLATMKWWTHLWLNEGFATFMGTKAVNNIFPDWKMLRAYFADDYLSALHEDGLLNTHAIEVEVVNPGEISEIFDTVTYSKGCIVNFMLQHYLGEDVFREGLETYLGRFAYKNASTEDLWKILESISGKPVTAVMDSYTKQPGYPVIFVDRQDNTLTLRQKRFLADGSKDKEGLTWNIPLSIEVDFRRGRRGFAMVQHMLEKREDKISNPEFGDANWIKLNPEQTGFYRVCYSPEMLTRLAEAVKNGELSPVDRFCLLDDTMAMARAGFIRTSLVLDLLDSYRKEDDYFVLRIIAGIFASLDNLLDETPDHFRLREMAREFFRPIAWKINWNEKPEDSHIEILKRSLILSTYASYGGKDAIGEAKRLFWRYRGTPELNPNLLGFVYGTIASNGGKAEYAEMAALYKRTTSTENGIRLLRAMGQFKDGEILNEVLKIAISKDEVRPQDAYYPLVSMSDAGAQSRRIAWEFIKNNWHELTDRYSGGGLGMLSTFAEIPAGFTGKQELEDVKSFYAVNSVDGIKRTVEQVIESIGNRIKWLERDKSDIEEWFKNKERNQVTDACSKDNCATE